MPISDSDRPYLVAFSCLRGVGAAAITCLAEHFPSLADAWRADARAIAASGVHAEAVEAIAAGRQDVDPQARYAQALDLGLQVVAPGDADYPSALANLNRPPAVLYLRGHIPDRLGVAVVGTRKPTVYGQQVCAALVPPLARAGLPIVSGLAFGIDTLAHQATVAANGTAVAVVGSGLDPANFYPQANRRLADAIVAGGGAVLTEFAPGTPPLPQNFPQRNRLLAALGRATVVVEASLKSGALITAAHALELGRDVFAVPGSILSEPSAGPNRLIRDGAAPVTNIEELLEALGVPAADVRAKPPVSNASPAQAAVLTALGSTPVAFDVLVAATGLPAPELNATLSLMELNGMVRNVGGGQFVAT